MLTINKAIEHKKRIWLSEDLDSLKEAINLFIDELITEPEPVKRSPQMGDVVRIKTLVELTLCVNGLPDGWFRVMLKYAGKTGEISELSDECAKVKFSNREYWVYALDQIEVITELKPAKPDPFHGWTPETLVAELRKRNKFKSFDDMSESWKECCREHERLIQEGI